MFDLFNVVMKNPTLPVICVATLIAVFSLKSQRHLARAKHTLDFEKEFKDKETVSLRSAVKLLKISSEKELRAMARISSLDDENVRLICDVLNVWEGVAIGVKKSVYDEDMLFMAFGDAALSVFIFAIPFIQTRRVAKPGAYVEFSWLIARWMQRAPDILNQRPVALPGEVRKLIRENGRLRRALQSKRKLKNKSKNT